MQHATRDGRHVRTTCNMQHATRSIRTPAIPCVADDARSVPCSELQRDAPSKHHVCRSRSLLRIVVSASFLWQCVGLAVARKVIGSACRCNLNRAACNTHRSAFCCNMQHTCNIGPTNSNEGHIRQAIHINHLRARCKLERALDLLWNDFGYAIAGQRISLLVIAGHGVPLHDAPRFDRL